MARGGKRLGVKVAIKVKSATTLYAVGCAVAVSLLVGPLARADETANGFAVAATAGTGGLGAEATLRGVAGFSAVDFRVAGESYGLSHNVTYDAIAYSGKLDLSDVGAYVDLHPFSGVPLVASFGVETGQRRLKVHAVPAIASVTIGGVVYSTAQVGTLDGAVQLSKSTPYLGLGWRQPIGSHLFLKLDAGAAFGSTPAVSLNASSGLVAQADLANERSKIAHDANLLKTYPLVTAGLGWRF
jgi:hypothetical protein